MMKSITNLTVWQKSIDLVVEIYRLVKKLPKEEMYSLSDQMRRAAVSIPSNVAEGRNRSSEKDFVRFLYIAKGSTAEIETQLFICIKLGYLEESDTRTAFDLCAEIGKILNVMISRLSK